MGMLSAQVTEGFTDLSRPSPIPVLPALRGVVPEGGLRPGTVTTVEGSPALALALMAGLGERWCAVVGLPEIHVAAMGGGPDSGLGGGLGGGGPDSGLSGRPNGGLGGGPCGRLAGRPCGRLASGPCSGLDGGPDGTPGGRLGGGLDSGLSGRPDGGLGGGLNGWACGGPDGGGLDSGLGGGPEPRRVLLVDDPGRRWADVVAALTDGCALVLTRPPGGLAPAVARRLTATARRNGCALVATEPWEGAHLRLRVEESHWSGLGEGTGHLRGRRALVSSSGRGAAGPGRNAWLWLPGPDGAVTLAKEPAPRTGPAQAPWTGPDQTPLTGPAQAPRTSPTQAPLTGPAQAPLTGPAQAPRTSPTKAPWTGPAQAPPAGPAQAPPADPAQAPLTVAAAG